MNPIDPTTETNASVVTARQRSAVYGMLAQLYYREPDLEMVRFLRQPQVIRELIQAGMALDRNELLAADEPTVRDRLAEDYNALFIDPRRRVLLNESVHREDDCSFMGRAAAEMKETIASLGLELDAGWTDFPDHISVEFEIMQKLTEREAQAREEGDGDTATRCHQLQLDFSKAHILGWIPNVCRVITARAGTAFYRELATITAHFLDDEHRLTASP